MRLLGGGPSDLRLPDPGVREVFSSTSRRQRYLDVEAALAGAQAECGLIPPAAAQTVAANARLELLDADRLAVPQNA